MRSLGLGDRVEIRDGYIPNEEAALLFGAADASLLPYRSASQSGVVQLSFAYGRRSSRRASAGCRPRSTTASTGSCASRTRADVAAAIERMAASTRRSPRGRAPATEAVSFRRYCELLDDAVAALS